MTLQSSGAISLSNLQSEYGGSNPISMSEYYRGGSYVQTSSTTQTTSSWYGQGSGSRTLIGGYYSSPDDFGGWNGYKVTGVRYGFSNRGTYQSGIDNPPSGSLVVWNNVGLGTAYARSQYSSQITLQSSYTSGGYTYQNGVSYGQTWTKAVTIGDDARRSMIMGRVRRIGTTTVNKNTTVPSSGTISLSQFYGQGN